MKEVIGMSAKERDRLVFLRQVEQGQLSQIKAAELLKISDRQVRTLLQRLKEKGDLGVVSRKRGKVSNNRLSTDLKEQVLGILSEKFPSFGPTFAAEKLIEYYDIHVSKETLRSWMIEAGLWELKQKERTLHKPRLRRACFGELIQGDGSHHQWFGPDGEFVNLTLWVDDATGMLTGGHFSKEETLEAYFIAFEQHLVRYGRPMALYTDHSAICEVRQGDSITQFDQALKKLDVELILAGSPQAKGRVERANRTCQDRLLKELWLRGIKTIEEANKYLPEFIEDYNEKFSREPRNFADAHRPLEGYDLSIILRRHEKRTLIAGCVFQYKKQFFEVKGLAKTRDNTGRKVDLCVSFDGSFRVFIEGIERDFVPSVGCERPMKPETKTRKELNSSNLEKKVVKLHPWRRWDPTHGITRPDKKLSEEALSSVESFREKLERHHPFSKHGNAGLQGYMGHLADNIVEEARGYD